MQGGETSDSERPIIIGHEEALSIALFDDVIDYVALGHLHKPQKVQHPHIRYSGSPIPLSFSEIQYKHQVLEVKIDPQAAPEQRLQLGSLLIPRSVQLHRIRGSLDEVFQQLKALPQGAVERICQRDYLEIEYSTDVPPPVDLRQQIEQALPEQRYRLLRICRVYSPQEDQTADQSKIDLAPPTPDSLFKQLWSKMGYQPDASVERDFMQLLIEAQYSLEQEQP